MSRRFVPAVGAAAALAAAAGLFVAGPAASETAPSCASPYDAKGFEAPAQPGVVPDVVCMDLQLAQDKLEAAGFTNLRSTDGRGLGRYQTYDRNWYVTAQNVPAGEPRPPDTRVTLTAVKYGDPDAAGPYDRSQPAPMPNLLCFDLQEAQDTLQSVGFYQVRSKDASGAGRASYADRNWTVVNHNPPPGRMSEKGEAVTIGAVKDDEPKRGCPR